MDKEIIAAIEGLKAINEKLRLYYQLYGEASEVDRNLESIKKVMLEADRRYDSVVHQTE